MDICHDWQPGQDTDCGGCNSEMNTPAPRIWRFRLRTTRVMDSVWLWISMTHHLTIVCQTGGCSPHQWWSTGQEKDPQHEVSQWYLRPPFCQIAKQESIRRARYAYSYLNIVFLQEHARISGKPANWRSHVETAEQPFINELLNVNSTLAITIVT